MTAGTRKSMSQTAVHILIVAAGRGSRAGQGLPKQYRALGGKTVLSRTLAALLAAAPHARTTVVAHGDDLDLLSQSLAALPPPLRARSMRPSLAA